LVSALASINVVNRQWARLVVGWVTACGQPYFPSWPIPIQFHLGQLSLPSLWCRSIEYQPVWVKAGCVHLCQVAGNTCDPIWQVTLRSCVMGCVPLTAIQYLYLFAFADWDMQTVVVVCHAAVVSQYRRQRRRQCWWMESAIMSFLWYTSRQPRTTPSLLSPTTLVYSRIMI